jgi:hypothetical protein
MVVLEREGHESVLKTDPTGLTSMNNRSDWSSQTNRQIVQKELCFLQERFDDKVVKEFQKLTRKSISTKFEMIG